MSIRPFDWRDLPKLYNYRKKGLFLDKTLVLTRGSILVPAGAILSYFAPATGIFTYLSSNNGNPNQPLIGQVIHEHKTPHARLSFLAPETALDSPAFSALIEHMISRVGKRGAFHLLAEVDQRSPVFEILRRHSFAIYARQRIWRLTEDPSIKIQPTPWRESSDRDTIAVKSLYNNLVPGLVQQVEPLSINSLNGLVYSKGNELLAFIEIKTGSRGIWMQPFVHPDSDHLSARLADLVHNLPYRGGRPVYLCVRSYQSWLEPFLDELGAKPSPLQAVMVKHLVIAKRVVHSFRMKPLESGHPEATARLARSECKK